MLNHMAAQGRSISFISSQRRRQQRDIIISTWQWSKHHAPTISQNKIINQTLQYLSSFDSPASTYTITNYTARVDGTSNIMINHSWLVRVEVHVTLWNHTPIKRYFFAIFHAEFLNFLRIAMNDIEQKCLLFARECYNTTWFTKLPNIYKFCYCNFKQFNS